METTVKSTNEEPSIIGQCKWFNDRCGYGFISYSTENNLQNPDKDIFVHYTNIQSKNIIVSLADFQMSASDFIEKISN